MYCNKCGTYLSDDSNFCNKCGAQLSPNFPSTAAARSGRSPHYVRFVIAAVCLALLVAVYAFTKSTKSSVSSTAAPSTLSALSDKTNLSHAERLYNDGKYHDAAVIAFDTYWYTAETQLEIECTELLDKIAAKYRSTEPKTGTEFKRTFPFAGGGEFHVTAQNGAAIMTVTDIKTGQYVSTYVRKGETAVIPLPAGAEYKASCKIGYVWFNDSTGFGDACYEYEIDGTMVYEYSSDNAWIYNTVYNITV